MAEETEKRHRTLIERALEEQGFADVEWYTDAEEGRIAAKVGTFIVIEEDEDAGLYMDDEGVLSASVVGSLEYENERVYFSFATEHHDDGNEVRDLSVLEPT